MVKVNLQCLKRSLYICVQFVGESPGTPLFEDLSAAENTEIFDQKASNHSSEYVLKRTLDA